MENDNTRTSDRKRSRPYPFIDLEDAIKKVEVLLEKESLNWTPINVAMEHWELSPSGSTAHRTLSAAIQYGLLQKDGNKKSSRRVKVSDLAHRILGHPDEFERKQAIITAAQTPTLFKEQLDRYGERFPSNESLKWDLVGSGDINERSADLFVQNFRATIEFANLTESLILSEEDTDKPTDKESDKGKSSSFSPKPQEATAMPTEPQTFFDLPIRLTKGMATLRTPFPMTSDDFEHLKSALSGLDALRGALVGVERSRTEGQLENTTEEDPAKNIE